MKGNRATANKHVSSRFMLYCLSFVFFFYLLWGAYINFMKLPEADPLRLWFTDTYWILPLVGSLYGFITSNKWGGLSSVFGKSISFFALGLFFQVIGQVVYSAYAVFGGVDVPYPSLGDFGFFGSIPLYLIGLWQLGKTLNLGKSLKLTKNFVLVLVVMITVLATSYYVFLKDYVVETSNVIQLVLDFGYPLGQSLYVGVAVLVYILSVSSLGGKLKQRVLFLLFALGFQYLADFIFLFRQSRGAWIEGGISDILYLTAYFLMGVSLVLLDHDVKS